MLHAPSDLLNKPGGQTASPSTMVDHDASKTIVHAVCSGRSIVGVVAAAGGATSAVVTAALDDLASQKTRIIHMRRTMVSCLGPASAMDHLRVSKMQINGGNDERSKQIVQGLQLLGQPVPGEMRRLLVIEEAEDVDPALLENLARMPGLATPTLPLQLLYVGAPAYWESLVALSDGAARRLIISPMILLQAPLETGSVAPSPVTGAKVEADVASRASPKKTRRSRWLLTSLGISGVSIFLGVGLANQSRLVAFIKYYQSSFHDADETRSRTTGMTGPLSGVLKDEADRSTSSSSKTPENDVKTTATEPKAAEAAVMPDVMSSNTIIAEKPVSSDGTRVPSPQVAGSQHETPLATLDPTAAASTISTSMSRGDAMLALHDLSAARRYYELAAKVGSADAALALGRTYDPTSMVRSGAVSVQPDATLAAEWYRRAAIMGSSEAEVALRNLGRRQSN